MDFVFFICSQSLFPFSQQIYIVFIPFFFFLQLLSLQTAAWTFSPMCSMLFLIPTCQLSCPFSFISGRSCKSCKLCCSSGKPSFLQGFFIIFSSQHSQKYHYLHMPPALPKCPSFSYVIMDVRPSTVPSCCHFWHTFISLKCLHTSLKCLQKSPPAQKLATKAAVISRIPHSGNVHCVTASHSEDSERNKWKFQI